MRGGFLTCLAGGTIIDCNRRGERMLWSDPSRLDVRISIDAIECPSHAFWSPHFLEDHTSAVPLQTGARFPTLMGLHQRIGDA